MVQLCPSAHYLLQVILDESDDDNDDDGNDDDDDDWKIHKGILDMAVAPLVCTNHEQSRVTVRTGKKVYKTIKIK